MAMSSNVSRQLSSVPQTHRQSVLQSISNKAHNDTSKIVHVQAKANKLQQLFTEAPKDVQSRIDWIHQRLQGTT